jgi:hypothetical protein
VAMLNPTLALGKQPLLAVCIFKRFIEFDVGVGGNDCARILCAGKLADVGRIFPDTEPQLLDHCAVCTMADDHCDQTASTSF